VVRGVSAKVTPASVKTVMPVSQKTVTPVSEKM
jgi:hypothetical protein